MILDQCSEKQSKLQERKSLLISKEATNFHKAWKDEWKAKNFLHKYTEHIRHIHMKNDKNNNEIERLNGTIRDREKIMRSLKKDDSLIITGMQIHHNYLRPYSGFGRKIPAKALCVKVEGNNKWITIIQNVEIHEVISLYRRK